MKKALSLIFSAVLLFCLIINPAAAFGITGKEGAYTYEVLDDGTARITEYDKSVSGNLMIPSKLGGKKVTQIAGYVFQYDENLTSVTIPEGVTYIGELAFNGCKKISTVSLPSSLTGLGRFPFNATPWYSAIENDDVVYVGTVLSKINAENAKKEIVVKAGTTGIADYAFANNTVTEKVVLPDSVKYIGSNAFSGCSALKSVNLPKNLTGIGSSAFSDCTALTSVELPAGIKEINPMTFMSCPLTSVVIPEGIATVGDAAFMRCNSLEALTLPVSLKEVRSAAFAGCEKLETLYYAGTDNQYSAIMIFPENEPLTALKYQAPEVKESTLYKKAGDGILLIPAGTTIADYYAAINENFYYVDDGSGKHPSLEDKIASRMQIRLAGLDYLAVVLGDTDGDGNITSSDARTALRTAVGLEEKNDILVASCDVDNSGDVTAADARSILRAAVGLDDANTWFDAV